MPTYEDLKSKLATLREEMKTAARTYFEEGAKKLFDENPDLNSFSWKQYTPYFNDGDTCTFSANVDYPSVNGMDEYGYSDDGDEEGDKEVVNNEALLAAHKQLCQKVADYLKSLEDEDFLAMFGDHVKVTVKREGVQVDEYEHD